jgi:hypothetical protein
MGGLYTDSGTLLLITVVTGDGGRERSAVHGQRSATNAGEVPACGVRQAFSLGL